MTSAPITFGLPDEQADFAKRNAKVVEVWPDVINRAFSRQFTPRDVAESVVFTLGHVFLWRVPDRP